MSNFMLGNLTVEEMEDRLGFTITDVQRKRMSDIRCNDAQISQKDNGTVLTYPLLSYVAVLEVAYMWRDILEPKENELQTRIEFAIQIID